MSGDSGHGSSQTDAYDELFHTPNTVDLNLLNEEQEETGSKVSFCSVMCLKKCLRIGSLCLFTCTVHSQFLI